MKGYPLSMFSEDLSKVQLIDEEHPSRSFDVMAALGEDVVNHYESYYSSEDLLGRIPARILQARLTFDQLCKVHYGRTIMMDSSVEDLYKDEPTYAVVRKIGNSMWRWGCGSGVWNEVVEAYDGIKQFDLGIEGFEVRLDFTTGYNERGYSRESRTFLDGVFGFLIYYKGEHVMTLGFSVMEGRKLLVQQVQLTKRKGNRFLFKLPENRVEFFLQCFAKAFPSYKLCIADGADIARINLNSYKRGLEDLKDRIKRDRCWEEDPKAEVKMWREKIQHLEGDLPRLAALYANTGRFTRGTDFTVNRITHYELAA